MFVKSANSIIHHEFRLYTLNSNIIQDVLTLKKPVDVQDEFLDEYYKWINSSKLNSFKGLEKFNNRYISLGVTQAIDDFIAYTYKANKNLKIFKGEYPYVKDTYNKNIEYIDDKGLQKGDAVIVSTPFSATGDVHPRWCELIDTCNKLSIPVFVDCAFFGTCYDIHINFDEPCINTVAFSPTKGLNCGYTRTGICFTTRTDYECAMSIQTEWHHGVHLNTAIALNLMKEFSPDTVPNVYKDIQLEVCNNYNLQPTKTVHLALGNEKWDNFSRDGVCNRIGIRNQVEEIFKNSLRK